MECKCALVLLEGLRPTTQPCLHDNNINIFLVIYALKQMLQYVLDGLIKRLKGCDISCKLDFKNFVVQGVSSLALLFLMRTSFYGQVFSCR